MWDNTSPFLLVGTSVSFISREDTKSFASQSIDGRKVYVQAHGRATHQIYNATLLSARPHQDQHRVTHHSCFRPQTGLSLDLVKQASVLGCKTAALCCFQIHHSVNMIAEKAPFRVVVGTEWMACCHQPTKSSLTMGSRVVDQIHEMNSCYKVRE
jgi:hypothetical protein